jgi:hypothetical protein
MPIFPAERVSFALRTPADWDDDPRDVAAALTELGSRIKAEETADYLLRDGSLPMTGALELGGNLLYFDAAKDSHISAPTTLMSLVVDSGLVAWAEADYWRFLQELRMDGNDLFLDDTETAGLISDDATLINFKFGGVLGVEIRDHIVTARTVAGPGNDLIVRGGQASGGGQAGGDLELRGGIPGSVGTPGKVRLQLSDGTDVGVFDSAGLSMADDLGLPTGKKLTFDDDADTYFWTVLDDVVWVAAGGSLILALESAGCKLLADLQGNTKNITGLADLETNTISAQGSVRVTMQHILDLDGNALELDADADTSITADTDDQIDFACGGADVAVLTSAGFDMQGKGVVNANAGTSFPGSPTDGDRFYRTDLDWDFIYDGGRAKWLGAGAPEHHAFGMNQILTSSTYVRTVASVIGAGNNHGVLIPYDMTIVGFAVHSNTSTTYTGTWYIRRGSTIISTIAVSAASSISDMTRDDNFAANGLLNCSYTHTSGTNTRPILRVWFRRRAT